MHRKSSERCQSGETETSFKSGQPGTRRGRGTSAQLSGGSADEDVVAGWIEHPVVAFARIVVVARYFDETFVETQIVADRVLPGAGGHAPVVGEVADHPGVDLFDGEAAARRRLDGEEGEAAV